MDKKSKPIKLLKVVLLISLSTAVICALDFLYTIYAPPSALGYPAVIFHPVPYLDRLLCPKGADYFIRKEFELDRSGVLKNFEQQWLKDSPELLRQAIELTGHTFAQKRQHVYVHRCQQIASFSNPTTITGAALYQDFFNEEKISGTEVTEMILFHELLHSLVFKSLFPKMVTPLIWKYRGETTTTIMHLHLFALQKLTLITLDEAEKWNKAKIIYLRVSPGSYDRALEIVDREGEIKFVNELKASQ